MVLPIMYVDTFVCMRHICGTRYDIWIKNWWPLNTYDTSMIFRFVMMYTVFLDSISGIKIGFLYIEGNCDHDYVLESVMNMKNWDSSWSRGFAAM